MCIRGRSRMLHFIYMWLDASARADDMIFDLEIVLQKYRVAQGKL